MKLTYEEYWKYINKTPELVEYLSMRYFKTTRCLLTDINKQYIYNSEKYFMDNLVLY